MAQKFGDTTGNLDDRVRLVLGGSVTGDGATVAREETVAYAVSYDVDRSILTQPSKFNLRFGWGDVLKGLIDKVQPGRLFKMYVGDTCFQTGIVDGFEASSDASSGGSLSVHGRDMLAPLHDAFVEKEKSYKDLTFAEMVDAILAEVYSGDLQPILYGSNDTNRKLSTGIGVKPTKPGADGTKNSTAPKEKFLKTRIGERKYEFIKHNLDRAGLFLWATGDGNLVLSAPNGNQPPLYRILRQRGLTRNAVNVISVSYKNATEGRYTNATMYGKTGGKKFTPGNARGSFEDAEMTAWFGRGRRPLVLKDHNITNPEQAEFYARRKLAEARRSGWNLNYTLAGHTIPSLQDSGKRILWAPDTVVEILDDELGIYGSYYIERVVFKRSPHTTTELTLMRPEDLIFALGDDEAS